MVDTRSPVCPLPKILFIYVCDHRKGTTGHNTTGLSLV